MFTADGQILREYVIWYTGVSEFASSESGKIILFIVYAFRDLFFMILEIAVNVVSIYYIKCYLSKKSRLVAHYNNATSVNMTVESTSIHLTKLNAVNELVEASTKKSKQSDKNAKTEMKASVMVVIMCLFSLCAHVLAIACVVYLIYNGVNIVFTYLCLFANISTTVKHGANFVLFYAFKKTSKMSS